jgi:primosomal protein N' (replication factor Y)
MAAFAEVIVTVPVEGRFHYSIPPHLADRLQVGHRVAVPFGRRRITAFVTGFSDTAPEGVEQKIRAVSDLLDDEPVLTDDLLNIVTFASEYYLAPVGEVLKVALPPGLTAASVASLRLTALGREALTNGEWRDGETRPLSSQERDLLQKAGRAQGVRRTARLTASARKLSKAGLLTFRENFNAREMRRTVEVVERQPLEGVTIDSALSRAPMQRKVYEALEETPITIDRLLSQFESAALRRAIRGLETKKLAVRSRAPVEQLPASANQKLEAPLTLSPAQAAVLEQILSPLHDRRAASFLLRGVTGSGKTEIYLRAIAEARSMDLGAIVLVPEIALTSQLADRFRARFGDDVMVLHSALTDLERRQRWHRLRTGAASIALGPRSAIWAPVQKPGVIVVDEEHDPSFKQNTDVRYNGRDLALVRAMRAGAVCLLGSATPSLESRYLARSGRITELRLAERVAGRPLPKVRIVNIADAPRVDGDWPIFCQPLSDALREVVESREQGILFLNRRGFNTVVVCEDCKQLRRCGDCSIALTHHKTLNQLICHYCGHREPLTKECTECGSRAMLPHGVGTERVEEAVRDAAPDARVLRLDRDITSKVGALEETLERFRNGEADILVGTQMVAKGHDFPNVTLVGIICADASLAFPDFRAAERTFQLLTQVAGRAGRAERPGRVIVQAFQPEHYALTCALEHDDDLFFETEIGARRGAKYPPFERLGLVRVESENIEHLEQTTRRLASTAQAVTKSDPGLRLRGPTAAPIERIRGRFRRMLMVLAPSPARLVEALRRIKTNLPRTPSDTSVIFDVDAIDML